MMRSVAVALVVVSLGLLSCVQTKAPRGAAWIHEAESLDHLFSELAVLNEAGPDALRQEAKGLMQREPIPLLPVSLILALLGQEADRNQARRALRQYLTGSDVSPANRLLAALVEDQLQAIARLQTQLSEAEQQRIELVRELEQQRIELVRELEQQRIELARQLEELKAIDQELRDRNRILDMPVPERE
ncbi:hypothetical protein ABC977_10620 [Thioalkalicoccus limnaeus]|uniref:Uncharacterized protein n=1 Tax=Thioalkalicoccus limnaeus TaxID=120681 RepID=A0ABV4BEA7_9GAMM